MPPRKRQLIIRQQKVKLTSVEDRSTQTREGKEQEQEEQEQEENEEENAEEEEGEEEIAKQCPVCLLDFSSRDRRITILSCAHLICSTCSDRLESESFVKCPLCRSMSKKNDIKILKFLSIKCLCRDERKTIRKKIIDIQDKHLSRLFKSLIKVRRSNKMALKNSMIFPKIANKISIRKNRTDYVMNRDLNIVNIELFDIERLLNIVWESLDHLYEVASSSPIHYDWSKHVIKRIVKKAFKLKK